MTATTRSTLAGRLKGVVMRDGGSLVTEVTMSAFPKDDGDPGLSPRDYALLDWGELAGAAWTLALVEAPLDPKEMIRDRATEAARALYEAAYERVGPAPDVPVLVAEVVRLFDEQPSDRPIRPDLREALEALSHAVPVS